MTKWKLWIVMVVIFAAGIGVGIGGTGLCIRHKINSVVEEGAPAISRLLTERLSNRLDLTADQQRDVTETLNRTQQQLAQLRKQIRPQVQTLVRQTVLDIRAGLTPKQQQEFDTFIQPFRERWQDHLRQQDNADTI
ncbi:MAG: hypothetical protein C0620_08615 [Desulfuromonas sp.]|nr:MAG: hypothetical protein C0620_08615 [Desulfuromonas sp.]